MVIAFGGLGRSGWLSTWPRPLPLRGHRAPGAFRLDIPFPFPFAITLARRLRNTGARPCFGLARWLWRRRLNWDAAAGRGGCCASALLQARCDDGHAHFVLCTGMDDRAEEDVGVGIDRGLDRFGRLGDFRQG